MMRSFREDMEGREEIKYNYSYSRYTGKFTTVRCMYMDIMTLININSLFLITSGLMTLAHNLMTQAHMRVSKTFGMGKYISSSAQCSNLSPDRDERTGGEKVSDHQGMRE